MKLKWQIIILFQAAVEIFLGFVITKFNILPLKYLIVVYLVLFLIFRLMYKFIKPPKRIGKHAKKSRRARLGKYVSLLVSIAMIFSSYMLIKTNGAIAKMTGMSEQKTVIALVALKKNGYKSAKDVEDEKVGINTKQTSTYLKEGKSLLKDSVYFTEKDYNDYKKLGEDLYSGKVKAILMDYAYETALEGYFESFNNDTEIIWSHTFVEKNANTANNKNVTKEPFTIIVSGVDSRGSVDEKSRSDVNMIVTINPNTRQILLTSIPRDYFVTLANVGVKDKLTHAGMFGTTNVEKTVEKFMDLDIDYQARIGFQSVVKIVDALGGVDVYSDKAFKPWTDNGVRIKKGVQHMDGRTALAFARERKIYLTGDRHRAANQQAVLKAILNKAMSPAVITNYTSLLDAVAGTFQTNMKTSDITSLAKMQLDKGGSWDIQQSILEGTSEKRTGGYLMPRTAIYYTIPSKDSINKNRLYITNMLAGKKIKTEASDSKA